MFLRLLASFSLVLVPVTCTVAMGQEGRMASPSLIAPGNMTTSSPRELSYADDEAKVDFRRTTVLVQVPVVVSDKAGNHIHNLTKDQFRVLENSKEQKIAAFEEIVVDNSSSPAIPVAPGTFRNLAVDTRHPQNISVIAIDTVNTPFLDQANARSALARYLADNLNSGQALALVQISSRGLKVAQELTSDPSVLIRTLKQLSGEVPAMENVDTDVQAALMGDRLGAGNGCHRSVLDNFLRIGDAYAQFKQEEAIETTMRSFLDIAWFLSGFPGRKSLIWATGGFPFDLSSPGIVPGGGLTSLYERAMEALNDAQIAVYPVDVRGLVSISPGANARGGGGATFARRIEARSWLQLSTVATLKEFAAMTGGRAFYNSNDLAGGFKRAADDSASYYMLGYYLDTKNTKPGWRRLDVKVGQKNAEVRGRGGFLVTNTTMNPQKTQDTDFAFAVNSPFDSTGIPIWMQWQEVSADNQTKTEGRKRISFDMHLAGDSVSTEGDQNAIDLDFLTVISMTNKKDALGKPLQHRMKANLSPQTLAMVRAQGMKYSSTVELPVGSYEFRFVVRDNISGRIGTVSAPLNLN
jgi:VWFA-related protein